MSDCDHRFGTTVLGLCNHCGVYVSATPSEAQTRIKECREAAMVLRTIANGADHTENGENERLDAGSVAALRKAACLLEEWRFALSSTAAEGARHRE